MITTHHYPHGATDFVPPIRAAHAMRPRERSPTSSANSASSTRRSIQARARHDRSTTASPGALLWSLRFHRREGGFYWHMEVGTGGNFYKAYHWPGFDSGAAYDETAVLALMRDKAFEIQGLAPPAIEPPAAAALLPIETPGRDFLARLGRRRVVRRRTRPSADGPWTIVGETSPMPTCNTGRCSATTRPALGVRSLLPRDRPATRPATPRRRTSSARSLRRTARWSTKCVDFKQLAESHRAT